VRAFARILLHWPDIIVLDEATSALDPESQDKLMELLTRELAATTIVSVGHRPELEAFHSRKIVLERRRGGARFVTDINLIPRPGRKRNGIRREAVTPASHARGIRIEGSAPFFDAAYGHCSEMGLILVIQDRV
jgi:ABC-type multidrug transport system ATPase subunit